MSEKNYLPVPVVRNALMGMECKTIEDSVQHGFVTFMTM